MTFQVKGTWVQSSPHLCFWQNSFEILPRSTQSRKTSWGNLHTGSAIHLCVKFPIRNSLAWKLRPKPSSWAELSPADRSREVVRWLWYYPINTFIYFSGGISTKRYCSSLDLGNYCNYVQQPGDKLEYRTCIYTCGADGCNTGTRMPISTVVPFLIGFNIFRYMSI